MQARYQAGKRGSSVVAAAVVVVIVAVVAVAVAVAVAVVGGGGDCWSRVGESELYLFHGA